MSIPSTKAQIRAVAKYEKANVVRLAVKLNKKTDADILARLEQEESKQGFIKACIRARIHTESGEPEQ